MSAGDGSLKRPVITLSQLSKHSSGKSLWLAIDGKVYNVSQWQHAHPGGPTVLHNYAGADASEAFAAYHPASARRLLDSFCVGHLESEDRQTVPATTLAYHKLLTELQQEGLFHTSPYDYAWAAAIIVAFLAGAISCVLQQRVVLGAVLLAGFWQQVAFVGHDLGHSAVFHKRRYDQAMGLLVNAACGISFSWWCDTHNVHHMHPNAAETDPDIQFMPLLAVSPLFFESLTSRYHHAVLVFNRAARRLISYQHYTFLPLLMVAKWGLYGQAFETLISRRVYFHRPTEALVQLLFFAWVVCLTSCLSSWPARLAFIVIAHAAFAVLHLQICLSHFSRPAYPAASAPATDWLSSQVAATMNWTCPSWMDWFHGGLQFQIEHHVFPRLPRHHLRAVSMRLRPLTVALGLDYHSPSFWGAIWETLATLRGVAMQCRQLPIDSSLGSDSSDAQLKRASMTQRSVLDVQADALGTKRLLHSDGTVQTEHVPIYSQR